MAGLTDITISGRNAFDEAITSAIGDPLRAATLSIVQVNIGLKCNLACHHCHVESSPTRTEQMDWPTMRQVLDAAARCGAQTIDITGGAPEMHPHFRRFVSAAREAGHDVIVRTNLTIMLEEDHTDLPEFFAAGRVQLVASLPCYLEQNVDKQRGKHVYAHSIEAIRQLNTVGYGIDPTLTLDLVYNPLGPALPPAQPALEADYRKQLADRFGIHFTRLLTITNMVIGRFRHDLERDGELTRYEALLRDSFNGDTVEPLMCRHQIHVGPDGTLHDCDFNFALGLPVDPSVPRHIADVDPDRLRDRPVVTGDHCFGCTAGCGSSCGGALV